MNIGTDITKNERFKKYLENEKFLKRVLSLWELKKYNSIQSDKSKIEFLAGRFSAKESIVKASDKQLLFTKISIENTSSGKPIVMYENNKLENVLITISHETDYTVTFSIIF